MGNNRMVFQRGERFGFSVQSTGPVEMLIHI